jgi:hypothetical protein
VADGPGEPRRDEKHIDQEIVDLGEEASERGPSRSFRQPIGTVAGFARGGLRRGQPRRLDPERRERLGCAHCMPIRSCLPG